MEKKNVSKKVTTINPKAKKINITMNLSKFKEIVKNGYGIYSYEKAEEQRASNVTKQAAGSFLVALIHWTMAENLLSGDLYNMLNADSEIHILDEATDITLKIVFDPKTKKFYILDGEHRRIMILSIFNNSIKIPTLDQAMKWNIYVPAYENVYILYGGKTFAELPLNIRKKIQNHPILVQCFETSSHEEKTAIFSRDNCGRKVSNNDMLNSEFCNSYSWLIINAIADSLYDETYSRIISYRDHDFENPITRKEWKILKERFEDKRRNSLINFFIRNIMINDEEIPANGQNAINSKFLKDTKNYSENKATNMIKKMIKQLTFSCNILDIGTSPLTVYTAWTSVAKDLTTTQKKELTTNKIDLNADMIEWFDEDFSSKKSVCVKNFDIMTDTFHNVSRIKIAKNKATELVDKYCI